MKYKKPTFWMIYMMMVGVVVMAIILLTNPARIELPDVDAVQSLELEWMNLASPRPNVTFSDIEHIQSALNELGSGRKTLRWSVNDYPYQENVLILRLNLENERRTFCLYEEAGAFYLEEPYVGVYRIKRNAHAALNGLYAQ